MRGGGKEKTKRQRQVDASVWFDVDGCCRSPSTQGNGFNVGNEPRTYGVFLRGPSFQRPLHPFNCGLSQKFMICLLWPRTVALKRRHSDRGGRKHTLASMQAATESIYRVDRGGLGQALDQISPLFRRFPLSLC